MQAEPDSSHRPISTRDTAGIIGFAVAATAAFGLLYWHWYIDDTFIYLQFSRNIMSGHGFSFNAGEVVYAVTGPLWALLIAALSRVGGLELLLAAKSLGVCAGMAATVVYFRLAARIIQARWLVWVATLLFVADGWWARTPFSGMEGAGVVLTILLALLLRQRESRRGYAGFSWSVVVMALGALIRPEMHLLFALSLAARVYEEQRIAGALRELLTYMIVSLPWLVYAYAQFGTIVPTTFAAKRQYVGFLSGASATAWRLVRILGVSQGLTLLIALLAAPLLARDLLRKRLLLLLSWTVALPVFYVARGVNPLTSRYLIMIVPLIAILGVRAAELLATALPVRTRSAAQVTAVALLISQAVWFQFFVVLPSSRLSIQDFDTSWKYTALWLRDNTPPETRVAAGALGIVGYYSERYIVDISGLVRPDVLGYPRDKYGIPWTFIDQERVDYLQGGAAMPRETARMRLALERPLLAGVGLANSEPTVLRTYRIMPPSENP